MDMILQIRLRKKVIKYSSHVLAIRTRKVGRPRKRKWSMMDDSEQSNSSRRGSLEKIMMKKYLSIILDLSHNYNDYLSHYDLIYYLSPPQKTVPLAQHVPVSLYYYFPLVLTIMKSQNFYSPLPHSVKHVFLKSNTKYSVPFLSQASHLHLKPVVVIMP